MIKFAECYDLQVGRKFICYKFGYSHFDIYMKKGDLVTVTFGYASETYRTIDGRYMVKFDISNIKVPCPQFFGEHLLFIDYDALNEEEKFIYHVCGFDSLLQEYEKQFKEKINTRE